ncbi:uncharacterized protein MELLADRAFT_104465 [Melampsora larici-populina 98AG31]|uniref:Uncharacterized protein n=1 Tax=Melampsora larici-populina (strain 98AG31 / pathotype 3-4-7) TaxID=747676 RepID=F4RES6_MELLP|nr:uncharacterized protein MELLADRAFT_104465 [Melampsora larici-populina 98AG31]EGG09227.1 hypothetical protein MELLADRAFT_104465 [Melampsora larici-populina 98AG31]
MKLPTQEFSGRNIDGDGVPLLFNALNKQVKSHGRTFVVGEHGFCINADISSVDNNETCVANACKTFTFELLNKPVAPYPVLASPSPHFGTNSTHIGRVMVSMREVLGVQSSLVQFLFSVSVFLCMIL